MKEASVSHFQIGCRLSFIDFTWIFGSVQPRNRAEHELGLQPSWTWRGDHRSCPISIDLCGFLSSTFLPFSLLPQPVSFSNAKRTVRSAMGISRCCCCFSGWSELEAVYSTSSQPSTTETLDRHELFIVVEEARQLIPRMSSRNNGESRLSAVLSLARVLSCR